MKTSLKEILKEQISLMRSSKIKDLTRKRDNDKLEVVRVEIERREKRYKNRCKTFSL